MLSSSLFIAHGFLIKWVKTLWLFNISGVLLIPPLLPFFWQFFVKCGLVCISTPSHRKMWIIMSAKRKPCWRVFRFTIFMLGDEENESYELWHSPVSYSTGSWIPDLVDIYVAKPFCISRIQSVYHLHKSSNRKFPIKRNKNDATFKEKIDPYSRFLHLHWKPRIGTVNKIR